MGRCVALVRGINVGRAKAVAMADLARLVEGLGHTEVTTLLRSGNVVFRPAGRADPASMATRIEAALYEQTGVSADVVVVDAARFGEIADAAAWGPEMTDGSRAFVTFLSQPLPAALREPVAAEIAPETWRTGDRAIYQWLPDGALSTRVPKAVWRQFGGIVTTRNWNTVLKLRALLDAA